MAKNDGYRFVYIDETMFTRKTVAEAEWALPGQNMTINEARLKEPTLAVLAGISMERGHEHYRIYPKSVDIPKFKEWLRELKEKTGTDKICIFMDQLNVHTSNESKDVMRDLGFRWIYNVSYSP